ncbi:MAG: ribosome small subunit-dependent GTPase A [Acidobacteriota bacterium]
MHSSAALVYLESAAPEAAPVPARLGGALDRQREKGTTLLAAGDHVLVERRGDDLVLIERLPRQGCLSRRNPRRREVERVLAAHVDQALVLASLTRPEISTRLVDRQIVAASIQGLTCALGLTKADEAPAGRFDELAAPYRQQGYPVFALAHDDDESLRRLRTELLAGKTTVLFGPSGVGKSTLRNALLPEREPVATGALSSKWQQGRHVTTAASLERLPEGGYLIDTPGVRGFGLHGVEAGELHHHFPEFADATCHFNDCVHQQEPGCGLVDRVERGEASAERLESLRAMATSLDEER